MFPKPSDDTLGQPIGRAPEFRIWPPIAIGLPWLVGFAIGRALGWSVTVGPTATVVGWALLGGFAVWNGWCLILFVRRRTGLLPGQRTTVLLRSGPYRLSRNPLYVGLLVLYVGVSILRGSPLALAFVVLAWVALRWGAVLPEERYLRTQVGPTYQGYCRDVRRWL